jgi:hypothetical protein
MEVLKQSYLTLLDLQQTIAQHQVLIPKEDLEVLCKHYQGVELSANAFMLGYLACSKRKYQMYRREIDEALDFMTGGELSDLLRKIEEH